MSSLTLYVTNQYAPLDENILASIVDQLTRVFKGATVTTDSLTKNITVDSTALHIFAGRGIPVKLLGDNGDFFFSLTNTTVYFKQGEWLPLEQIQNVSAITDAYYINSSSDVGAGISPTTIFSSIALVNHSSIPIFASGTTSLYVKNNIPYLWSDGINYRILTEFASNPNPNPNPNPGPDPGPNPTTPNNIDDDEEDMAITPYNLSIPSQTLSVNSSNFTNMTIINLNNIAATNPTSPSFKVEFYNNAPDLIYFVLGNGVLPVSEFTSYVIEPSEKKIIVVAVGNNTVSAVMGGSSTGTGELRTTVMAFNS